MSSKKAVIDNLLQMPSKVFNWVKSKKQSRNAIFLLFAVAALFISYSQYFERYELQTYDWRFQLRPEKPFNKDIVIVEIWDDTVRDFGRWPFDREYHAILIQALKEAGAKAVVFDVLFVEPTDKDALVAQQTKKADNVYYAFAFGEPQTFNGRFVAHKIESLVADVFARTAKGIGFVNIQVDLDGKRRRVMPIIQFNGLDYYHLSLRVLFDVLNISDKDVVFKPGQSLKLKDGITIPLDEDGCMLINYAGKWQSTFKHVSYRDVIASYIQTRKGLKPIHDLSTFKDKICIVGLTAQGTHDTNPNPIESVYPGVGTYANVINTILQKDFIQRLDRIWNIFILMGLMFLAAYFSYYKKPIISLMLTVGILVIFIAAVINLFIYAGLWVDMFFPAVACGAVYAFGTLTRIVNEMRKRELIEGELKIASQIQKSFLPAAPPESQGLSIAVFMKPAKQVGGDLYAFVKLPDDKVGVMVGDVSGKGAPAALFMGKSVSEFKFSAKDRLDPADVLSKLNDSIASESTGGLFVTLTYVIFDLKQKKLILSNGGHLPLVKVNPDKSSELITAEAGMPIGVMEGVPFANFEAPIRSGECYAFYSDGISEARNRKKDEYSVEALQKVLSQHLEMNTPDLLNVAVKECTDFIGKAEQHDDMTLIVVKIT